MSGIKSAYEKLHSSGEGVCAVCMREGGVGINDSKLCMKKMRVQEYSLQNCVGEVKQTYLVRVCA